jgi:5-methylcytosine-specific restriction endonuclease McrA
VKRVPLRSRSKKQAAKDREYTAMRIVVLERDDHTCQLRMDGHHCTGTLHVHHIRLRAQGGSNHPDNLVTLCGGPGSAHDWVHANPAEAALFGLIKLTEADQ